MINHKILIISNGIFEQDGRLKELVSLAELLGEVHLISRASNKAIENHYIFNSNANYIQFILFCKKIANNILDITIILSDNRKALIPAWLIKNKNYKKASLISDSREFYIMRDVRHLSGKIGCIVEHFLYKKFDIIIAANRERSRIMKMYYKLDDYPLVYENLRKLTYSQFAEVDRYQEKYESYFPANSIKIVSTSGYSFKRGGKQLIEEVGSLGIGFTLYVIGGGTVSESTEFRSFINEKGFTNVIDAGRVNADELKYFIQQCDIGVVFYHLDDLNNRYCASGKVYEFLFEGLPLACSTNIPLKKFCKQYEVGASSSSFAESVVTIANQIEWYRKNVELAQAMIDIDRYRTQLADEIVSRIGEQQK